MQGKASARTLSSRSACRPSSISTPHFHLSCDRIRIVCRTAAGASGDAFPSSAGQNIEKTYQPFPRLKESDPYKLLGVSTEADFEEVVSARNFLTAEYKWHEPSRESIELAFDYVINDKLKFRNQTGFRAARGRGGRLNPAPRPPPSLMRRIEDLFDPTVTLRTFINEGVVFFFLAAWVLCSTGDPSFPLAGAVAYSVHKFLSKRTKANPQGPFLGGNPVIGAILSTVACLALSFLLAAVSTAPLRSFIEGSVRQVGGFLMVMALGAFSVYLK